MAIAIKSMQLADSCFGKYLKEGKSLPNPEEIKTMAKDAKFAEAAGMTVMQLKHRHLRPASPKPAALEKTQSSSFTGSETGSQLGSQVGG